MSISTEITRLQEARNKLRTKAVEIGISTGTAKLDELAAAYEGIVDNGAVSASVKEGETYTIPKGYHNGSGTVSGVAGGGNYNLQSKQVTPTKMQQSITSDEGYYGLSDVTVKAIPDNYQDVSSVTTIAEDVLANKIFVTAEGAVETGTMPNNGTVNKTLDSATTSYVIPKGYHSGTGSVSITPETKTITPTESEQIVSPASGNVLSQVTVEAIPSKYKDVSSVTATADHVLADDIFVNATGKKVTGTMPNIGQVTETFDGISTSSYMIPKGYHDGTGSISLTNDIEISLASI